MVGIYTNHELPDAERRSLIFAGNLLLYGKNAATTALAESAIESIAQAFSPRAPQSAQFDLSVEEFVKIAGPLKTKFTNALRTKELVRDVLVSFDCDLNDTYFDVPRLRIVPHGGFLSSGVSYAYKAHRDIWYSSPTAQVNWWMPVFPVTADRAMSFFTEYWDKPVKNTSADFDYADWCAVGRQLAATQVGEDTRRHPLPQETVSTASELRIAGTTGETIMFSASQLHSTAPNQSGLTRFSIDFRTFSVSDLRSGRGSPNIDTRSRGTTTGDFLRGSDFQPLDPRLIERQNVA